jgi:hypothetical protein
MLFFFSCQQMELKNYSFERVVTWQLRLQDADFYNDMGAHRGMLFIKSSKNLLGFERISLSTVPRGKEHFIYFSYFCF